MSAGPRAADEPANLKEALGRYAETDRIALEMLKEACGENRRCLEEVSLLANYIRDDCAHDSTCPKTLAGLLDPLDRAQKSGLVSLPDSYPLASELRDILERATHDEARDEAGRPSQPPPTGAAGTEEPAGGAAAPAAETAVPTGETTPASR